MIPKLTFEVIDNPKGMINLINIFLNPKREGFDWRNIYYKTYKRFGELTRRVNDYEEIKKISEDFFMNMYYENLAELEKTAKKFQKEWNTIGDNLLSALSKVVEKGWPKNCQNLRAWVSLNPICPRFLDQKSFDVFWKLSPDQMKALALHEILHFIWFEKWKEIFPKYNKKEFESPHLAWKLSEMVPLAVLGDKRIQEIYKHEPTVYDEWKNGKINGKPLLSQLQEMYGARKSFEDFMKESWKFVKKHEKEINEIK